LIIAAITGTAAVKIKGSTIHSAVSIPIEIDDGNRLGKLSPAQLEAWTERRYMVIDEISMMDCKIMEYLHTQLAIAKARLDVSFGGINIIFFGDFLQLSAVRNPDLYIDSKEWGAGHHLWRSLNAVIILKEQIRQAGDPLYASLLSRLRLRVLTDEDIEILRRRIGARLPNMQSVPAIIRHHALRHAMNMRRLHEAETKSDDHIIYCMADITDVTDISMLEAHQIRFGDWGSRVEAIVPLLCGVPLLITRNISKPLGMCLYMLHLTNYRLGQWENRVLLWIHRL
jgi:PIF1-like helicase